MVDYLQAINLQGTNLSAYDNDDCDYLLESVDAWTRSIKPRPKATDGIMNLFNDRSSFLISVSIRPARCYDQFNDTSLGLFRFSVGDECPPWTWLDDGFTGDCIYGKHENITGDSTSLLDVANSLSLRVGSIKTYEAHSPTNATFAVSASYNYTETIRLGAQFSFLLELLLLVIIIVSLLTLRTDAIRLVLGSLRSMLRIVAQYAKNPLGNEIYEAGGGGGGSDTRSLASEAGGDVDEENKLDGGTYETEQLVTAVSKIADLLRKCWGVAGADIISTNLASRDGDFEVFNPTVPGRNVFALFAFAAITDFDYALTNLDSKVMILINDVADVLHKEVFRWGLGDSGQCNRNLGAAFFMVFKIGSVMEVVEKLEEATRVVFSTANARKSNVQKRRGSKQRRSRMGGAGAAGNNKTVRGLKANLHAEKDVAMEAMAQAMRLSLQDIPGISTFTDRAVIGMLKAFAAMNRDNRLLAWPEQISEEIGFLRGRSSGGGKEWSINMIFGMDAGWAVEGAVGSEYKIDATYLSPHVNMSSRMMSACKQYGVMILVSEAVQQLLSEPAKAKMRNLDRVTVKGSSHVQNIYTYDARAQGADLFLNHVSEDQAEGQARNYEPNIWHDDPDLTAMRRHVTEDFEEEFGAGIKCYYDGNWPLAIEKLEKANDIMTEATFEGSSTLKIMRELDNTSEIGDRPSLYLIQFMKSKGGKAPDDWDGWHPLMSK